MAVYNDTLDAAFARDAELSTYKSYQEVLKRKQLEAAVAKTNPELAQRVIRDLPPEDKQRVFMAMNEPSLAGRLITAGLAGIAAPLLLGKMMNPSDMSSALQILSIPIAALGGATLADYLGGAGTSNFKTTMPTKSVL